VGQQLATVVLSGFLTLISAFGSIFLKDYLDRKRQRPTSESVLNPIPDTSHSDDRRLSILRPFFIALGAIILGLATSAFREVANFNGTHLEALTALLILLTSILLLVFFHAGRGPHRGAIFFQFDVLALWAGYTTGAFMIMSNLLDDLLAVTISAWVLSAAFGAIVIGYVNRTPRSAHRTKRRRDLGRGNS
jgi:hypothetical protein